MLQMHGCSINKHMVDEVKQREKETELQMQRRKTALDDSHMDTQLKQLSKQLTDCSARASALRKVSLLLSPMSHTNVLSGVTGAPALICMYVTGTQSSSEPVQGPRCTL